MSRVRPVRRGRQLRARLGRLDRQLLSAAARERSPVADRVLTGASEAANRSMLWVGVAGVLVATGRRRPRTAAAGVRAAPARRGPRPAPGGGLAGIGIAPPLVTGPFKFAWRRDRPPMAFRAE